MTKTITRKWLSTTGRYKNEIILILLILLLGLAVFLFFKSFFDSGINDLTTEILAALLGSIITVMITMLLIRQQGTIEHAQEIASVSKTKVFEKKLELFQKFIDEYTRVAIDGNLDKKELGRLEVLAMSISLLSHDISTGEDTVPQKKVNLGERISQFVLQLQLFGLKRSGELDKDDLEKYKLYFHEGSPKLLSILDLTSIMKVELLAAQSESRGSYQDGKKRDQWAEKLLNYREYRQD